MKNIAQSSAYHSRRERPFDERDNKRSQTAIDVKTNIISLREFCETSDIIHISVGEIGSRADQLKGNHSQCPPIVRGLIRSTDHDRIWVSVGNKRVRNAEVIGCEERLTWLS